MQFQQSHLSQLPQVSWFNRLIMDSCKTMCLDFETSCSKQTKDSEEIELEKQSVKSMTEVRLSSSSALNDSKNSTSPNQRNQSRISTPEKLPNATKAANSSSLSNDDRLYDIIVFGASGSIGSFLVEELALVVEKYYYNHNKSQNEPEQFKAPVTSTLSIKELRDPIQFAQMNRRRSVPRHMDSGITWAIAGRSAVKLSETLCQAELSTGIKDLSINVPIILADLYHTGSLLRMTSQTKLIINCAGPYSDSGEILIKACLNTKTDYIDLSQETKFNERIRRKYSSQAEKAGVHIINSCGFQSMSAEMGLNFIKQVVDGQIDEVKIILNLNDTKATFKPPGSDSQRNLGGIVSWGMWCSLLKEKAPTVVSATDNLHRVSDFGETREVESQSEMSENEHDDKPTKQLLRKDTQTLVKDIIEFRNRDSFTWFQLLTCFQECGRKFCFPTNCLTSEEFQLIRGEMDNYEHKRPDLDSERGWRPIRCSSYLSLSSFVETIIVLTWLFFFNILIKFSLSRGLMKMFPYIASLGNVKSRRGSTKFDRDSLNHIKFCQTLFAYGTPGENSGDPLEKREKHLKRKQEQLLVARIVGPEPNHVATATFAIQAALALVLEKDHIPLKGRVLTPGTAFADTNIIYQLRRRNIKFEIMKKA